MELRAAQCPNCKGELQLPVNKSQVTCMYCDTSIDVKEAIGRKSETISGTMEKWFELARTAKEAGNNDEAIEYFNKILEADTSNAEAWFGKGYCIYNTSTLANIKLNEAITYFNNAIKYALDEVEMKKEIASQLNSFSNSLFSTAMEHHNEYHDLDDAAADLAVHSSYCLDALKIATEYDNQKVYIQNALDIYRKGNGKLLNQASQYQAYFQSKMKDIDPQWEPPKSGCFIATAVMGDYDHPQVMELRQFRDDWILSKSWGTKFVDWYYNYGAKTAKVIDKSIVLKNLSYVLIVKPILYLSRLVKNRH